MSWDDVMGCCHGAVAVTVKLVPQYLVQSVISAVNFCECAIAIVS